MGPAGQSLVIVADMRKPEQIDTMFKTLMDTWGRLDVLFNNAGIGSGGPIDVMTPDAIERTLDINLKGVFWGAQVGFPYLKKTPGSALVSTSSAAGLYASAGMSVYSATKFGVRAMTDSLNREWVADGVKARTIMPSFIDTPLLDAVSAGSNEAIRETVRNAGLEFTPVEQVAQAVWDAAHGERVHTVVGKTARRLKFATTWAPWLLPKDRFKR
jgi:NAD(P)-dependent dehydrogenase (short-subunit alcohol dehydrogenase family)